MKLNNLTRRTNRRSKAKRVGRGYGSTKGGHTSSFGSKGQKSRSGYSKGAGFEGGNVPLFRRLPKYRGFKSLNTDRPAELNFLDLEENFKDGDTVSVATLREKGLVKKKAVVVKILGKGDLTKKLLFEGLEFSQKALVKVKELGGEVK